MERRNIAKHVVVITTSKIQNDNMNKPDVPEGTEGVICRHDNCTEPFWTEVDFGPNYGKVSVVPEQIELPA